MFQVLSQVIGSAWAYDCLAADGVTVGDVCEANLREFVVEHLTITPGAAVPATVHILLSGALNESGQPSEPGYPHTFNLTLEVVPGSGSTSGVGSTDVNVVVSDAADGPCTDSPVPPRQLRRA